MASPMSIPPASSGARGTHSRRDRPCDACRKRKSRCVMNEGADICVLCDFHNQGCSFLERPQLSKKRRSSDGSALRLGSLESDTCGVEQPQRKMSLGSPNVLQSRAQTAKVHDYASLKGPSLLKKTLGLQSQRHSRYIGPTTEFEPDLIKLRIFDRKDESQTSRDTLRRVSGSEFFLMLSDQGTQSQEEELPDLDAIEQLVAPHGKALIHLYFRIIHPSYPILHKRVFLEKYSRTHREFAPPLLAAVYILALQWWGYSTELATFAKPNVHELERLARKTMNDVTHRPKLSTVQAGLLLLQRSEADPWGLSSQLVSTGQKLGLHLDCSNWKIPTWERGLRKRLAWGLFMQDKWGSLIYGNPSHISSADWDVRLVTDDDFPENAADEDDEEGSSEVEKGRMIFSQMISITILLSEVLESFYTVRANREIDNSNDSLTQILERAKPVQLRLKEWYAQLPTCLRMDNTKVKKLSSTGYLHLAYFATEITLHRRIIRSLQPKQTDTNLLSVCRSAASARFTSAIDFINRLRPEQLQSFWYFASKINFALIGTFGALLWATSTMSEEADFYKSRLEEYKWTLKVSVRGADFMMFAIDTLEANVALLSGARERLAWVDPQSAATESMSEDTLSTTGEEGQSATRLGATDGDDLPIAQSAWQHDVLFDTLEGPQDAELTSPSTLASTSNYLAGDDSYLNRIGVYETSPTNQICWE